MLRVLLIGKGYWGSILSEKLQQLVGLSNVDITGSEFDPSNGDLNIYRVVIVASSTDSHISVIYKIIKSGYSGTILCEKPVDICPEKVSKILHDNRCTLYVSDVWIYHNVIATLRSRNYTSNDSVTIVTEHPSDLKGMLYNLTYHDIYIILNILRVRREPSFKITSVNITDNCCTMLFNVNDIIVEFIYKLNSSKNKYILLSTGSESSIHDLNYNADHDSVTLMLQNIIHGNFDVKYNNKLAYITSTVLNQLSLKL